MTSSVVLTVVYTGEPDVVHEFPVDGVRRTFGRDEDTCDIVVWSAINERDLSRVAGVIWRMEDQLWVRNLSTRHELTVHSPDWPLEPPLPPRLDDGFDRGPARGIPSGHAFVRGPNGCELLVRQLWPFTGRASDPAPERATEMLPDLPDELRPVADALCEPLMRGKPTAAPYSHVAGQLGCTVKQARTAVGDLTDLYAEHVPALKRSIEERQRRERAALQLATRPVLRHGVWTFKGPAPSAGTPAGSSAGTRAVPGEPEHGREDPLALPAYQEVAHFLVLRGVLRKPPPPPEEDTP